MPNHRPLKIGVQLPEAERPVGWPELLTMAQRIEELGYDSIWVGDHLLYRDDDGSTRAPWEAWTLLSALAVATSRVEIGPLVACTSFHSPAMIAKKAATIDEISNGRLILGLGAGWNEPEYQAYGFPYDHRFARFEEAFTIIRTLLDAGEIDFSGTYYSAKDCVLKPRGPRPGGPPMLIGSIGAKMLALTLPYVSYWNAWYADYNNDPTKLDELMKRIDAACDQVGRNPKEVQRTVAVLVGMTGSAGRVSIASGETANQPIKGTTAELADTMRAIAAAGVDHVQLVLDPITIEAIEEFAPVLTALDAASTDLR